MACAAGGPTDAPVEIEIPDADDVSILAVDRPIVLLGDDASRRRIRLILDAHPNISCPPGSSFLLYLGRLTNEPQTPLAGYSRAEPFWPRRVAGFFGSIQAGYANGLGKERWAAEIPGHEIDRIDHFFPSAQVLYAVDPGNHTSTVRAARHAGTQMASGRFMEVRYGDLVLRPELTLKALVAFLGEPWHDDVLQGVVATPVR
jgi:hypothetical protein